jgi:outer membrane protein assembly factor BamB
MIAVTVACNLVSIALGQVGNEFRLPAPRPSTKVYFDSSHTADALLRSADNHAKSGDFAEAVEIYQRVIQQFGDKVVDVPPDPAAPGGEEESRLSVNARRECQRRIALLPADARALYRTRVDAQAERWYRQGAEARDRSLLRRVVDQAFCSSWGDDALDLLGDLAFQEGQFAEALGAYSQLVPDRAVGTQGLTHPDCSVDLARVAAKKLLCRAAIGDRPPTALELSAFADAHKDAPGPFAGRKESLAIDLIAAVRDDHFAPSAQADGRWPTFAGAPTRNRVAPSAIDVGSLQWKVELEPVQPRTGGGYGGRFNRMPATPIPPDRLLAYHPIVVGDQVIVSDDKQVTAYALSNRGGDAPSSVASTPVVSWRAGNLMGPAVASRGSNGLPRYTLTTFGGKVYARMGLAPSTTLSMNRMNIAMGATATSAIVALDRAGEGRLIWKREASEIPLPKRRNDGGSRNAVFEGTPIADAHNVYVAMTDRIEMTATYVVCLDADTGATRWVRYICEANANVDPFLGGGAEISHRLLTLDGPTLYYQTNLGAVAALDAESGGIRWLATYPWPGRSGLGQGHERDLNPAIFHDGLVIVAPDDTAEIYAFDAATGRLAWKSDPPLEEGKLSHLLGVAKGHLVATGDRVLLYDVKTGKLAHAWPDNAAATQGFGRGILAGDRIYWPTRTEIHVLDASTGLKSEPPIKLQETYQCEGGNLAVGDGYLVVAQATSLVVFCQNSRLIDRYREEIARSPDQAANYYLLAQAAAAIGRDDEAIAALDKIPARIRPSDMMDGLPLADATRDQQRRLLMKLGQKARTSRDWPLAAKRFAAAAEAARGDRDRLAARLELAEVELSGGDAKGAVATLQALLADERLRPLTVDAADGHRTVRADLLIADRLATILRDQGRELYAEFDRAAQTLLERGETERNPRLLEDVGRSFPVARVVPDAWLALGRLQDDLKHPGEAARAYRRLLAVAPDDAARGRALWGLARAYEAQKLWVPARDTYAQVLARFASQPLELSGEKPRLGTLAAERLGLEPFQRMTGDQAEPSLPIPLRRRWGRKSDDAARPLAADGVPPSAESGRIFLVKGRRLRPVDPATGGSSWVAELDGEPIWVGYLADRIVAATATHLAALSLDKGTFDWKYDIGGALANRLGADPFAREPVEGEAPGPSALRDFRIVGNRIFCLRGEQALLAFDGDSGLLEWSYTPPSGRINPRLLVGPRRIVFQVRKPNAVVVLETASGRKRGEFPQTEEEEWQRDPLPIDDDHVALVADKTTVALLDLARGRNSWVFQETRELPKYSAPRLFGDAERLLVLHDGQELIRLDPATGAKAWSRLLGSENLSERPEAIALASDQIFVADGALQVGSTLTSYALSNGGPIWKAPLAGPDLGWSLALTERSVVAYPGAPRTGEEDPGSLPVIIRRRDDGALVQRLLFPTPATDLTIRLSTRGALVATRAGVWALGDRQVMDGSRGDR